MSILKAHIQTERASRYLVQFCKHAAAMGSGGHRARMHLKGRMAAGNVRVAADWSDSSGTVTFTPWGRCTLTADTGTLTVHIDAVDQDGLTQIRDIVTRDLRRFSDRDPLTVTWQEAETSTVPPATVTPPHRRGVRRPRLQTLLLAAAAVVVVAVHVGLVGTVVAESGWTTIATNLVVAAITAKVAFVAWTHHRIRRRKAAKPSD